MASHRSAEKRARQGLRRQQRNRNVKGRIKTVVKSVRTAIESGQADDATRTLREAERQLRKAASKGVIPKRRADRRVARLSRAVSRL